MNNNFKVIGILNLLLGVLAIPYSAVVILGIFGGTAFHPEFTISLFSALGTFLLATSGVLLMQKKKIGLSFSYIALTFITLPFWAFSIYEAFTHPQSFQIFKNISLVEIILPIGAYGAPNPFILTIYLILLGILFRSKRSGITN